jgi:hypothetical protein
MCKETQLPGVSFLSAILVVLGILVAPTASAQDGVTFSISPRLYSTYMDTGDYSEVTGLLMPGLSMTAGPASGKWDVTVNALFGDGLGEWTQLSEIVWGQTGEYQIKRTDIEVFWHGRPAQNPVYLGAGVRWVGLEESYIGDRNGWLETDTTHLIFGEFNVGFFTQVSPESRHSLFGNFVAGAGRFDYRAVEMGQRDITDSGPALMFEINTGYQFAFNRNSDPNVDGNSKRNSIVSVRYRIIAVNTAGAQAAQHTVHGPEIAYTFRF